MSKISISDISDMTEGDPIIKLQATVKAAYPPSSYSSEYGEGQYQSCTLEDETGTIRATFFDPARDLRHLKGNLIEVVSGKDGKGRFSGITATDYENRKTGSVTRQIKVSSQATIDEVVGGEPRTNPEPGKSEPEKTNAPRTKGDTKPSKPYVDETRVSIERQVALQMAIKFGENVSLTKEEVVEVAEYFYNNYFSKSPAKTDTNPEPEKQPEPVKAPEEPKAPEVPADANPII